MSLKRIVAHARDKERFTSLNDYITFCKGYLAYIEDHHQAEIVSLNENHYKFYQYDRSGNFQITRPINTNLIYSAREFARTGKEFIKLLRHAKSRAKDNGAREVLNRTTYTMQQAIGAALDALPAGQSNVARKVNGDLFERLIQLVLAAIGVANRAGTIQVPVRFRGKELSRMRFQHDLIVERDNKTKLIGSIKTSSKDRLAKIFIDKFLYWKLTGEKTPHIAIFLNDVQRKGKHPRYGISATFLPGHFKGYTVKLNPIDGVYYCDMRPNMRSDRVLSKHIKTFDELLVKDVWRLVE